MPLNYQIDRLDWNDLDAIELEVNPSHDLVRALVRCIRDHRWEISLMEDEFDSLHTHIVKVRHMIETVADADAKGEYALEEQVV